MAAIQENTCAACGKASTTRCAGCIEGIDQQGQLSPTYYCSKDCQRAHWSQHKAECKLANAHKVLYRGGELVQEMFYKYRERFFDLNISKVRHNPDTGTVGVYEGERVRDEILIPFPTHLFTDDRDKQAALAWSACEFGVGYLSNQVKQAIKGESSDSPQRSLITDCRTLEESSPRSKTSISTSWTPPTDPV